MRKPFGLAGANYWVNRPNFARMTIAINTCNPLPKANNTFNKFVLDCFSYLAKKYPSCYFVYIFNGPFDKRIITSQNITGIIARPTFISPYRDYIKIPSLLNQYKATVLVSAGCNCLPLTKIPQCLLLQDLSFLSDPQFTSGKDFRFYERMLTKSLSRTNHIITPSQASKKIIIERYKGIEEKIAVVQPGINKIFTPLDEPLKRMIREKYAEGKEYFLYKGEVGHSKDLINLLKAFSFFKKRQKSNMLLLIVGQREENYKPFIEKLRAYKFRDEVKLLGALAIEELAMITAAAYAFVNPSLYEDIVLNPLEAMQCGVPVITGNSVLMREICGEGALYVNASDFNDIADKMMLLFKDEAQKSKIAKESKQWVGQYDFERIADLLWQSVLKCAGL